MWSRTGRMKMQPALLTTMTLLLGLCRWLPAAAWAEPPAPVYQRSVAKDEVLGGIAFDPSTMVRFHDRSMTHVKQGQLAQATRIGKLVLRAGTTVTLTFDGALESGTLERDSTVSGICCRGGRRIRLHRGGALDRCELCADAEVATVPLRGGTEVSFYNTSSLWRGTLSRDHLIDGVPLAGGTTVELHPGGKLVAGTLARQLRLGGFVCAARGAVAFDAKGRLRSAVLARPVKRGKVLIPRRSVVELSGSGRIRQAELAGAARAQGLRLGAGSRVVFHEQGAVDRLMPTRDVTFRGIRFRGGSEMRMECCDMPGPVKHRFELVFLKGRLWSATLKDEQKLGGLWLRQGSTVSFHDDGSLDQVVLGRDQIVDGKPLKDGAQLRSPRGARPALRRRGHRLRHEAR